MLDGLDLGRYRRVLERIPGPSDPGAPSFPREAIFRSFILLHLLGYNSIADLVRQLRINPSLTEIVGFIPKSADEQRAEVEGGNLRRRRLSVVRYEDGIPVRRCKGVPSRSVFSRAFAVLRENVWMLGDLIRDCVHAMHGRLPDLGREVAVDSTVVETFCNPNRDTKRGEGTVSDPEAGFTKKNHARAYGPRRRKKDGRAERSATIWVYGYKMHLLVCAKYEVVLAVIITPANVNDSPLFKELIKECRREYAWFGPRVVIADRGYDSGPNNVLIHSLGWAPVIHKRVSDSEREGGIHNALGVPRCIGAKEMEFMRTDEETGCHLYRCPAEGCELRDKAGWSRYCDYEVWEDPEEDIRLFGGRIRRASAEWKEEYKKRWSEEHFNGRVKGNRTLGGALFPRLEQLHRPRPAGRVGASASGCVPGADR